MNEKKCAPILILKINVAASFNQLLRDGVMPIFGRDVERHFTVFAYVFNVFV